jgi:cytochrome c biogenesis protein CcmG/thiol:disulfide interchange protein DsbE
MPVGGHRGAPVVLTFFASWCTPCRTELPMIARVASDPQNSGSPVLFLGVDGNDDPASGVAFARSSGVTFPVAVDGDSSVAPHYALVGYPDTVFIDATGHIAGAVHGPVSRAVLIGWMSRLGSH